MLGPLPGYEAPPAGLVCKEASELSPCPAALHLGPLVPIVPLVLLVPFAGIPGSYSFLISDLPQTPTQTVTWSPDCQGIKDP